MATVHLVNDPRAAAMLAAPVRQRILEALEEPGSATTVARKLGIARQLAAYHVRQLESHGIVELVREEQRRGCVERIVRRKAQYLVASPSVLAPGIDPRKLKDKFSASYLIALASRMAQEVGDAQAAAEKAGKPLPTLSTDVEIRLRSPQEREAFAEELLAAIAQLAAKYHDDTHPDGRTYRVVIGAHPIRASPEEAMTKKPTRTLELKVDIDAPLEEAWKAITEGPGLANWFAPIGEVSAPGAGATVKTGWSEEMMMTSTVDAWEPLKHVRWLDESGWSGPGTSMAMDFHLSTENGKTRVRLVQSAFGASDAWDDIFAGTEIGWTYFLYNLRVYLETHLGRVRRLIAERLESPGARAAFWSHLLGAAGGLVVGGTAAVKAGDWLELKLSEPRTVRAVVEVIVEGHAIGLRLADLGDALLFIELEGNSDKFHVGYWLSVYDEAQARNLDSPARRAFKRVHETLGKS